MLVQFAYSSREADRARPNLSLCDTAANRLRGASYVLVAVSLALGALVTILGRLRATPRGMQDVACLVAFLLLVSVIFTRQGIRLKVADTVGTLGLNWLGGFAGAMLSVAGLHLKFPLIDHALRWADLAIGIDPVEIVRSLVRQGQWIFNLMAPAYAYTIPLVTLTTVALVLMGRRIEAWRVSFCFNGTLLSASLIMIAFPAKGVAIWFDQALQHRLPDHAATYWFDTFDLFYYGQDPELSAQALTGVISFPSFHLIMGLIILAAWRKDVALLPLVVAWFVVMVPATFAYGGHYAMDLVGGSLIWAAWFWLSFKIEAGSRPGPRLVRTRAATRTIAVSSVIDGADDALAA
jgi:hypothetical protein